MEDRYTKAVLTVIAVSLVWIVARDLPLVGVAQAYGEQEVRVVNWPSTLDVDIVRIDGKSFGPYAISSYGAALPVKVSD